MGGGGGGGVARVLKKCRFYTFMCLSLHIYTKIYKKSTSTKIATFLQPDLAKLGF